MSLMKDVRTGRMRGGFNLCFLKLIKPENNFLRLRDKVSGSSWLLSVTGHFVPVMQNK